MEGSKCRKCGDKPHFVEHIDKWYCFSCNTYQDEVPEEKAAETQVAVEQPVVEEPKESTPVVEEAETSPIAAEIKVAEMEAQPTCDKCGAELQKKDDGSTSCAMCTSSAMPAEEAVATPSGQSVAPSVLDIAIAEHLQSSVQAEPQATPAEAAPKAMPEPKPEPAEIKVRMCPSCGQPLKFIEKYSRYYCYSCKKYAPKEQVEAKKQEAPAAKAPEGKKCPDCGADLKFIEKYSEWYCYACKKYPLKQRKPLEKTPEAKPVEKPVAAPAPQPPAKAAPPPMCPKCGKPLKHVEKYDRHYCYECKQYAPKGHGSADATPKQEKKVCPVCNGEMAYIQQYNEWYCYKCKKYTLRPSKPILLI